MTTESPFQRELPSPSLEPLCAVTGNDGGRMTTLRQVQWHFGVDCARRDAGNAPRAATAACMNAQARHRGLPRFRVRGPNTIKGRVLPYAPAHNLMRTVALSPGLPGMTV